MRKHTKAHHNVLNKNKNQQKTTTIANASHLQIYHMAVASFFSYRYKKYII